MATLKAGWGYWRPHDYPNAFHRPRQDLADVTPGVPTRAGWMLVTLADGTVVETSQDAVEA